MDLLERYNALLRTSEDGTITMLNRVLDASFNRLVRRARVHMQAGYADPAQRNLALLQEFRMLVPAFNPNAVDGYDRILRNLVGTSGRFGLTVAGELTGQVKPGPRVDVSIPLEATAAAAAQAKGYLRKHGEKFAETAAEVVAQGVAEGRPTDAVIRDARSRLSVVKSRAEAIVRTESLRAYNDASNSYYAAQGIDLVMYYATADDRSCPVCVPRAGQIYRRTEIRTPLHPRCRCYLAPWDADVAAMDPDYAAMQKLHKDDVAKTFATAGTELVSLNKAAVFEQLAPVPVS
jgi:SPP1 gp7 family putative phage head morphogenesis protein